MKQSMRWIAGIAVLAVLGGGVAQAQKHHKGKAAMCPMMIDGAQVQVTNVEQGVTIHITAKDAATIKRIQSMAAEVAKQRAMAIPAASEKQTTYVCPMGDYKGPKTQDGRCPKCGMNLQKQ